MKQTLKKFFSSLPFLGALTVFLSVFGAVQVFGAPSVSFTATLLPISDSAYDIGTSTNAYRIGYFDQLCLTADTCKTAWPAGGAGSGDPFPFTKTTWGVSTSTVVGFVNGLMSMGSTTLTARTLFTGSLQASSTALFTNGLTAYASTTLQNFTGSAARINDLFQASSTALFGSGLTAYASSTLQALTVGGNTLHVGTLQASSTALFTNGLTAYASSTLQGYSSTDARILSSLTVVPLTSALTLTDGAGLFAEYAGTSCTNQFPRSLSALGAATCASVANTDLTNSTISGISLGSNLANLTATNGTLTFSATYNGSAAATIGLNLASVNTWTGGQTFATATSTGTFTLPIGASATTPVGGNVAIDSTTGQIRWNDNRGLATSTHVALDEFQFSTVLASSTLSYLSKGATTTILLVNPRYAATTTSIYCKTQGGTYMILLGDGTSSSTPMTCTTTGNELLDIPNGAFTARENVLLGVGTQTGSSDGVTVTITQAKIAD